jgi:hypothetical protein
MVRHLVALGFIYCCTAAAWLALGATIFQRTYASNSSLRDKVVSNWGAPHVQGPPKAYVKDPETEIPPAVDGQAVSTLSPQARRPPAQRLPLERSRVRVALDLKHRQKGLLWYSAYRVDFGGTYTFRNPGDKEREIVFAMDYPARQTIYDDLVVRLDGVPVEVEDVGQGLRATSRLGPGKSAVLEVSFRSQGLDSWRYRFGDGVTQVRDFELDMRTNFRRIDFPISTLSATTKKEIHGGWDLGWRYRHLVSGYEIGMAMPERPQPGPLAGRISLFAPVSLLFFFFVMFLVTTLRGIDLHPMNYFFLAAAFFAFHLLLAYLVDHVDIHVALAVCSVVSVALVVSYLRVVIGMRFAAVEAGLSQLVYLVLFSYAFFFEGYTGLAITVGAILSLFLAMQATARIRWAEVFARRKAAPESGLR